MFWVLPGLAFFGGVVHGYGLWCFEVAFGVGELCLY
jgi:hypothetical protein